MNRVFAEHLSDAAGSVVLPVDETHHLVRVRRARPGARVVLFDGRGLEADGRFVSVDAGRAVVEIGTVRRAAPDAPVRVTVVTAIPKGPRMADLVRACTEVGAHEIRPVVAERSAVRPPAGDRSERWARIAREAAKQSGRATVPDVAPVAGFAAAIEDAPSFDLRLMADAGDEAPPLRSALGAPARPASVVLAVGPEGGFTDDEKSAAAAKGFALVGLRMPVMRVETAAPVLVAVVMYACS